MRLLLISLACLSLVLLQSTGALAVQNRPNKAHNGKSGERKAAFVGSSAKIARRQDKRNLLQLGYGLQQQQQPQTIYGPPSAAVQQEVVHHHHPPPPPPLQEAPAVFEHSEPLPVHPIAVAPPPPLSLPVRPGIVPPHFVPVGPPAVDFGPIRFPIGPGPLPAPIGLPIGPAPLPAPIAPIGSAPLPVAVGPAPVPAPLPVHVITKHIAVPVEVPKPYPVHVEKLVHVDRPVHVPVPVEVHVPRPYPVAYPVEKIVRVDRPFPVHIAVPVHVPKPYPVPVAVRTHYEPLPRDW